MTVGCSQYNKNKVTKIRSIRGMWVAHDMITSKEAMTIVGVGGRRIPIALFDLGQ